MNSPEVNWENNSVAAAASPTSIFHRAPTLLASGTPGSGGRVRVWGPDPRTFWLRIVFLCGLNGLLGYSIMTMHMPFHGFELCLLGLTAYITGLMASEVRALKDLQFVVTDDAGIALSTGAGACAVQWNEIRSVERSAPGRGAGYLWLEAAKPAHVDLVGYSPAVRRELLSLITEKAGLQQDAANRRMFTPVKQ